MGRATSWLTDTCTSTDMFQTLSAKKISSWVLHLVATYGTIHLAIQMSWRIHVIFLQMESYGCIYIIMLLMIIVTNLWFHQRKHLYKVLFTIFSTIQTFPDCWRVRFTNTQIKCVISFLLCITFYLMLFLASGANVLTCNLH